MKSTYLLIVVFLLLPITEASDRFIIESEFGDEGAWTEPYLNRAFDVLVRMMDNRKIAPPSGIRVELKKDPGLRGIGGYASPTGIGFTSDCWPKDRDRLWIVTHELVNLFAHHYGGAGGYPADWWSNGRSPFPEYVSCLVMEKLGEKKAADYRRSVSRGKLDHELYWKLHDRYGFKLFARFFLLVQRDGIDMGAIGAPWPHPDERRSAYTIAYLSLAAGANLAALCGEHGIGQEPSDWSRIHPEIRFHPYRVTEEEVDTILAVREFLYSPKSRGKGADHLRSLFRGGRIYEPSVEVVEEMPPGDSPVAFSVFSDFEPECRWTKSFLERTTDALIQVLGIADLKLPDRITVTLKRDPDLAGIGGGATGPATIDLFSDCWPEEPFRHWIISQELAECLIRHAGGNLDGDWWGHGGQPFATFTGALALREKGFAGEADWVHDMHRNNADHEIFWLLLEQKGKDWIPLFFCLLRDDGIDFDQVGRDREDGQRLRSLYLIAYLSIAYESNLADLFEEHGIGSRPSGWDDRGGTNRFAEYRITKRDVDRFLKLRTRLFGGQARPAASEKERDRFRNGSIDL